MKPVSILNGLVIIILFSSCSGKTYFTEDIRKTVERASTSRIEKVQFYNDREIEIVYKTADASDKIEGGKVKFEAGFYYYYINFPKYTKAQGKYRDKTRLNAYFEQGEDRYLQFVRNSEDFYQLAGFQETDGFYVYFENKKFKVIEGDFARLMIKKNYKENTEVKKRTVKGVKVK
jgi:hypothetical protein